MTLLPAPTPSVAVIGAGPAGLMAAEVLLARGVAVQVFDAMPSAGRKFLLAGKGGLNLTHGEPPDTFLARYGQEGAGALAPFITAFGSDALRTWSSGLGINTFVGSSGRVFPTDMKAAPLLRAWLQRLRASGLTLSMRHRWTGWAAPDRHVLAFDTPTGPVTREVNAVVLALGGGSWRRLGSDGAWVPLLAARGVPVAPLRPSNCGFPVAPARAPLFPGRHAGEPVKTVGLSFEGFRQTGEFVITETGMEGSLVYAASSALREAIDARGSATFHLDLLPGRTPQWVTAEVAHPRGSRSLSTHLKSRLGLQGVKAGLLNELVSKADMHDPATLAARIKALSVTVDAARPLDEAISSAGGVRFEGLDAGLGARAVPGLFVAGEMLDWEAPTGGYLLTACFATGRTAGQAAADWLSSRA